MLKLGNKTAKTNPEKAQLFTESVERNIRQWKFPNDRHHFPVIFSKYGN